MSNGYDIKDEYGRKIGEIIEKSNDSEAITGCLKWFFLITFGIAFFPIWFCIYMVYKGWNQQPIGRKILWVLSCFVLALVYFAYYGNDPSNIGAKYFAIFYLILGVIGIPLVIKIR